MLRFGIPASVDRRHAYPALFFCVVHIFARFRRVRWTRVTYRSHLMYDSLHGVLRLVLSRGSCVRAHFLLLALAGDSRTIKPRHLCRDRSVRNVPLSCRILAAAGAFFVLFRLFLRFGPLRLSLCLARALCVCLYLRPFHSRRGASHLVRRFFLNPSCSRSPLLVWQSKASLFSCLLNVRSEGVQFSQISPTP